jgi:hypothetical protein
MEPGDWPVTPNSSVARYTLVVSAVLPRAVYQFFLNGGSGAWVVGLQPGLFDENGNLINRLGAAGGGTTITGTSSGGTSNALPVAIFTDAATPSISSLSPGSITMGDNFTLTITGADFASAAQVILTGPAPATTTTPETPTSVTPNTTQVSGLSIATAGTYSVTVQNASTGTPSNPLSFTVNAGDLVPVVTSISLPALYNALGTGGGPNAGTVPALTSLTAASPTVPVISLPAGSGNVTLIVGGDNFVPSATASWNNAALATADIAFLSDTQLAVTVAVPAAVPSGGSVTLSVSNFAGQCNDFAVPIAATNPTPPIASSAPAALRWGRQLLAHRHRQRLHPQRDPALDQQRQPRNHPRPHRHYNHARSDFGANSAHLPHRRRDGEHHSQQPWCDGELEYRHLRRQPL